MMKSNKFFLKEKNSGPLKNPIILVIPRNQIKVVVTKKLKNFAVQTS
jgi:hypothetical protein